MTVFKDREGEEIPLMTWAELYENHDYRQVAFARINEEVAVSTIWEGMVVPWREGIFETVIITDGVITTVLRAYTQDQAFSNHQRLLEQAREESGNVED